SSIRAQQRRPSLHPGDFCTVPAPFPRACASVVHSCLHSVAQPMPVSHSGVRARDGPPPLFRVFRVGILLPEPCIKETATRTVIWRSPLATRLPHSFHRSTAVRRRRPEPRHVFGLACAEVRRLDPGHEPVRALRGGPPLHRESHPARQPRRKPAFCPAQNRVL